MNTGTRYVLDAYALLSFFQNEPGADAVRELLLHAGKGEISLVMSVTNLGEVWYSVARDHSPDVADHYVQIVSGLSIVIVDANWDLTRCAAEYKMAGNISYADCFAAALAKIQNGILVTGDKEFKKLEGEVEILWLS
ncbi:MAG: type II toxin-antitoxin system VapC family toxin [Chloroflexota bacterium]